MKKYRKHRYGKIKHKIVGVKCKRNPACAVVCAIYRSEEW
jgi:hypothetical protein